MNLKDEEWEPDPTLPALLRRVRAAANASVSTYDLANLRSALLAPPFHGAIPHEVRGAVWLLLLRLRSEDLLSEDANVFAQTARHAVANDNSKEQIEKDVERTRPGLARFKQPAVRGALLRLLSLFCARRKVAYVQGFNELLAPFVLLADTGGNPRIVYALFSNFVNRFAPWMLETSESRVFDVLKRMFKYFGRLLLYHDPELYWLLERHMMTPDLYATSWFVTLFARNFTVESVLALWDLLLLEDNPLGTSFFGVALLCSKRRQLLNVDESRIPESLMMLTANSPEEVRKLWKIGSAMRVVHTPPSFQRLMTDRLLSTTPGKPTRMALSAARAMQASVCLQTTPDDLVAGEAHYFTWDCRTEDEYNSGHLAQAAYLPLHALREANGKITSETSDAAREELQTAVDLCEPLKRSSHICLVGSGIREEDNLDINMLALYLTRIGIPYVSTLRGGFREALALASSEESLSSVELVDYNSKMHQEARRARVSLQMKREQDAEKSSLMRALPKNSPVITRDGMTPQKTLSHARCHPNTQAISSFLEKTDAEVSKALNKALGGMGLKYPMTSDSGSKLENDHWPPGSSPNSAISSQGSFNPFSPNSAVSPASSIGTNGTNNGSDASLLGRFSGALGVSESGVEDGTVNIGPRMLQTDLSSTRGSDVWAEHSSTNKCQLNGTSPYESNTSSVKSAQIASPGPGVQLRYRNIAGESPSRHESKCGVGSFFSGKQSQWGRDAKPGWLGEKSLEYSLEDMPKGFTVNVLDDHVMAGLRLFPCKAKSDCTVGLRVRGNDFKRRFVGVSSQYFLLLSPQNKRSHLLEVNLIRYLRDIARITFKRSRPELVTFEILLDSDDEVPGESVVCLMPDGLKECVALIKEFIREDEEEIDEKKDEDLKNSANSGGFDHLKGKTNSRLKSKNRLTNNTMTKADRAMIKHPSPFLLDRSSEEFKSSVEAEFSSATITEDMSEKKSEESPVSALDSFEAYDSVDIEFGEFQAAPTEPHKSR